MVLLKETDLESDAGLVEECRRGDPRAFDTLVNRYKDRIYNAAYRFLGNHEEAADLCQEVFVRAYRAIDTFEGKAKVSTWLYSITLNLCRNRVRDSKRKGRTSLRNRRLVEWLAAWRRNSTGVTPRRFSVNALSRSFLLLASVILVTALVPIFGCPTGSQGQSDLASRVVALEGQVAALNAKLTHVSVVQGDINGLVGPHLIIEGCNLHVRDGSGATDDNKALNGLGNLIVGYNEPLPNPQFGRTGSHNVVIGLQHEYTSFAGLVAGRRNSVTGASSSVTGGIVSLASGPNSSVSGGLRNTASGTFSSVSGGRDNEASGNAASVSGGNTNDAIGEDSSVSGGDGNEASGSRASVSGGLQNTAGGTGASVSGGFQNTAGGARSSVSGGLGRTTTNLDDWAAGSLFEDN